MCARQLVPEGDTHAAVLVLVADCCGVGVGGVEPEPVIPIVGQMCFFHGDDHRLDGFDVVGRFERSEVDVRSGSAKMVRSEQDAS